MRGARFQGRFQGFSSGFKVFLWWFPTKEGFSFRLNRVTSFASCGLSNVQLSLNGPCICLTLSFSIFPHSVIQKSTSDVYIYTLMRTITHAGYASDPTAVLLVSEKIDANPQMGVTGLAQIFQCGFLYTLFLPGYLGYLVFPMCRRISSLICVIRSLTSFGF